MHSGPLTTHGVYMCTLDKMLEMARFERNINVRDVSQFCFEKIKDKKSVGTVSLNGRDARVICADVEDLKGASSDICPIFEGVYSDNDPIPAGKNNAGRFTVFHELVQ